MEPQTDSTPIKTDGPINTSHFSADGPRRSDNIGKLTVALTQAQMEFKPIVKETENPYYRSKYADLATLIEATREALAKHGLAVVQFPQLSGQNVTVTTLLTHESGEWMQNDLTLPGKGQGKDGAVRFDAQSIGSAITYARRYAYQAMLNIAGEEDDDGNDTIQRQPADTRKPPETRQAPQVDTRPVSGQEKPRPNDASKASASTPKDAGAAVQPPSAAPAFPNKEQKQEYVRRLRIYSRTVLPRVGVSEPATTLKNFIAGMTGVENPSDLNIAQWDAVLAALDTAAKESDAAVAKLVEGKEHV